MDIRPILSTLARHKTAAALIVLEVALSCAIICNAVFLITQRLERIDRPTGLANEEIVRISMGNIGDNPEADWGRHVRQVAVFTRLDHHVIAFAHRLPVEHGVVQHRVQIEPVSGFDPVAVFVGQADRSHRAVQRAESVGRTGLLACKFVNDVVSHGAVLVEHLLAAVLHVAHFRGAWAFDFVAQDRAAKQAQHGGGCTTRACPSCRWRSHSRGSSRCS